MWGPTKRKELRAHKTNGMIHLSGAACGTQPGGVQNKGSCEYLWTPQIPPFQSFLCTALEIPNSETAKESLGSCHPWWLKPASPKREACLRSLAW